MRFDPRPSTEEPPDEQENRIGHGDCIGANSVSSSAIRSAIEADRAIREPVASSSGASPAPGCAKAPCPSSAASYGELAENYGREAAKLAVVRTVDCSRRRQKMQVIAVGLTGHPFRQPSQTKSAQDFRRRSPQSKDGLVAVCFGSASPRFQPSFGSSERLRQLSRRRSLISPSSTRSSRAPSNQSSSASTCSTTRNHQRSIIAARNAASPASRSAIKFQSPTT